MSRAVTSSVCNNESLSQVFVCMQHTSCSWLVTSLSFGLLCWRELPEEPPATLSDFADLGFGKLYDAHVKLCSLLWVSWCLRYQRPQSSRSTSGHLNTVGLVFERERRCFIYIHKGGELDALFKFRQLICTAHIAAHIILPPVSTKLLPATLTLGVFNKKKKGMVSRCECVYASVLQRNLSLYVCLCVCTADLVCELIV